MANRDDDLAAILQFLASALMYSDDERCWSCKYRQFYGAVGGLSSDLALVGILCVLK